MTETAAGTVRLELLTIGQCQERAWFADRSEWNKKITFPAMVALLHHPTQGTILFDTGYGRPLLEARSWVAQMYSRYLLPFTLRPEEELPVQLQKLGVKLSAVVLSHFHPDHIGALRQVPTVPIYHSAEGLAELQRRSAYRQVRAIFFPELMPDDFAERGRAFEELPRCAAPAPYETGADLFGDGSLIAIPLPGHAIGQYGLLCQTTRGPVFLCADAAWVKQNFAERKYPAWPVRFLAEDWDGLLAQMDRLHALHRARPDIQILPTHCQESVLAWQAGQ